jgi:Na+/H+ antiporter NhaB
MFPPSFDFHIGLPFFAAGFLFYSLPAIIAWVRAHYNRVAFLALNLLLGWTVVGWIVSLVRSFTNPPPRPDEGA